MPQVSERNVLKNCSGSGFMTSDIKIRYVTDHPEFSNNIYVDQSVVGLSAIN